MTRLIDRPEFLALLDALEIDQDEFAWLTGVHRRTVLGWGNPRNNGSRDKFQGFPLWVPLLLDAWLLCDGPPREHPYEGMVEPDRHTKGSK